MSWRRSTLCVLKYAACSTGAVGQPAQGALQHASSSASALNAMEDLRRDDAYEDVAENGRIAIPWVRTVISGVGIMRNPRYNKVLSLQPPYPSLMPPFQPSAGIMICLI
jgi:uncharacterized protein YdbL (DUF1318 family)